jgi:hypothetical protein
MLCKQVAKGAPVLEERIRSPSSHFFDDFWVDAAAEKGCCPSNSERVARGTRDTCDGPYRVAHVDELILAQVLSVPSCLVLTEESVRAERGRLKMLRHRNCGVEGIVLIDEENGGAIE